MPLRKARYSFHKTLITGIHFHSSLYNKNLLFCLYRLFTSNARTIKQIRENSFAVFAFKTLQCGNTRTNALDALDALDANASYRCCITRVFLRIGHCKRKHQVASMNFIITSQRQFSKFTVLNSNSTYFHTNFTNSSYKKDDPYEAKVSEVVPHLEEENGKSILSEKPPLEGRILGEAKLFSFNERVKIKHRKDSLSYNILTEHLYKFRDNPLRAYEIYTEVLKNGLLNYIKSHHLTLFLHIICHCTNEKRFEWLIRIMRDVHSFNLKNRIPYNVYKRVLHKMVELNDHNDSLPEILDAIAEKNAFYGRIDAYRILVNIYCERGDLKEALYILRQIALFGQVPRKGLYSALIHELCKQGKLETAEELLEEFEQYLDTPDIFLFTSLISGYGKKGEIDKVKKLFERLLGLGIQPDRELYTTVIFAFLLNGDVRGAYEFYEKILEQGIKHDSYLYASLIYMRAIESDSENARKIFEKMKASGITPTTEIYNHLMYAYSRDNLIDTSGIEDLYLQMLGDRVKTNHYTYEILIDAMCRRHDFSKASKFLSEMKKYTPITKFVLNSIIRHKTLSENTDHAIRLYKQMISVGVEPDLYIYTSIISLATVSSKHSMAIKVFKELLAKGHKPNSYVYSALITSLVKAKKPQMAIQIFQQMVRDNVSLNHVPFTALIQSFVMTKRFEDGKRLYEMMKKMNLNIDRLVYYHFEKLIKRAKLEEELKQLYEDIKRRGLDPKSRDRIYTKGKGPSYWKLKFLIQRRILRQDSYKSFKNKKNK
ncbi:18261_t:CDS:1 [Funneliformis geosporum]|uniref:17037_t:CDS:1 n=1 Tax=Funneliformis geosporum TaxID=1117311 RepID=A0A9W4SFL7_9GLOM|nr:17037_t:CDS:1 [Funneliformis geosporum]CAI2168398.1 18261_t:CDS:1 [Funneliformis geosporum]